MDILSVTWDRRVAIPQEGRRKMPWAPRLRGARQWLSSASQIPAVRCDVVTGLYVSVEMLVLSNSGGHVAA